MNYNERLQHVPSDAELRYEELVLGLARITRAAEAARRTLPWHERMVAKLSSNSVFNLLFPNRVDKWRANLMDDPESTEIVQGLAEGDQFGGLHKTDLLKIVNRNDELAEAESQIAKLDAEFTAPLNNISLETAPDPERATQMAESARRTIESLADDNFTTAA